MPSFFDKIGSALRKTTNQITSSVTDVPKQLMEAKSNLENAKSNERRLNAALLISTANAKSLAQQLTNAKNSETRLKGDVEAKKNQLKQADADLKKADADLKKADEDLKKAGIKAEQDLIDERNRAAAVAAQKKLEYMKSLYNEVYNQNETLLVQQTIMRDSYSTDDQKVYYQAIEIQYLAYYNYILMIIYYILAAICIYVLFFRQDTITNIYVKGVLAVLILTYLYTIPYVESIVYNLLMMSSSLIYGDVYLMKY